MITTKWTSIPLALHVFVDGIFPQKICVFKCLPGYISKGGEGSLDATPLTGLRFKLNLISGPVFPNFQTAKEIYIISMCLSKFDSVLRHIKAK